MRPGRRVRPHAAAEGNGTVALLWDFESRGFYLDISFYPDGTFGWYGEAKGIRETESSERLPVPRSEDELPEVLRALLRAAPVALGPTAPVPEGEGSPAGTGGGRTSRTTKSAGAG